MQRDARLVPDVGFWHFSDLPARPLYVRFWSYFGPQMLAASISQSDPKRSLEGKPKLKTGTYRTRLPHT